MVGNSLELNSPSSAKKPLWVAIEINESGLKGYFKMKMQKYGVFLFCKFSFRDDWGDRRGFDHSEVGHPSIP